MKDKSDSQVGRIFIGHFHFPGKRYVYRFVCDLNSLLGYKPEDYFNLIGIVPQAADEDE